LTKLSPKFGTTVFFGTRGIYLGRSVHRSAYGRNVGRRMVVARGVDPGGWGS